MIICRGKEEEKKVAQLAELLNLDKSEIIRRAIEQGFQGTIDDRGPWAVLHGGGDRTRPPPRSCSVPTDCPFLHRLLGVG
jgi:hypothetical protein